MCLQPYKADVIPTTSGVVLNVSVENIENYTYVRGNGKTETGSSTL